MTITVEVFASVGSPACEAKLRWLSDHGTPHTVTYPDQTKAKWLRIIGHDVRPTVVVWTGEHPYKARMVTFSGYRPDLLKSIHNNLALEAGK